MNFQRQRTFNTLRCMLAIVASDGPQFAHKADAANVRARLLQFCHFCPCVRLRVVFFYSCELVVVGLQWLTWPIPACHVDVPVENGASKRGSYL